MIETYINNETSLLKSVVLGTARDFGGTPPIDAAYDPKSREHILDGTYPAEDKLILELEGFAGVLEKYGVKVYRPEVLGKYNQIFSRDIGFVVEDKFVKPSILKNRTREIQGIEYIIDQIPDAHLLTMPKEARIEGGDVMPWNDRIFVGYSDHKDFDKYVVSRTNKKGVDFLKNSFPNKEIHSFQLNKSDAEARDNALHLDCCFQPIGTDQAIIYPGGFKNMEDVEYLTDYFGQDKLIHIDREEMYHMNSNVFSISPTVIVSERKFTRLNGILKDRGFIVESIDFSETSKMEGLLRCSTLPLQREI